MPLFKEDFQNFIDFLKTTDDPDEMKKAYRKILMTYHPDHAAEKDKELYNEYILLINKAYAAGRTKTKETEIKNDAGAGAAGQTYVFTKKAPTEKPTAISAEIILIIYTRWHETNMTLVTRSFIFTTSIIWTKKPLTRTPLRLCSITGTPLSAISFC